jgi:hypothetical protein
MIPNKEKIKVIKENLFERSIDAICDYEKFDWHIYNGEIDTDKVNSSQAIVIDFWGCLKLSAHKDHIINKLFNKDCNNWTIKFEHTDKSLLSEVTPTQIDVIIESDSCAIIIESKFTEAKGGSCSQTSKTKYGQIQCNGNYEEQINPVNGITSKCALTGKRILYWDYIDTLTNFKKNMEYNPCPFQKSEFQWIRNVCFSEAYAKHKNIESESFLVYYESEKCPISNKVKKQSYLGKLKENLRNSESFKPVSYNNLLEQTISYLDSIDKKEKSVWMELRKWMQEKERNIKTTCNSKLPGKSGFDAS